MKPFEVCPTSGGQFTGAIQPKLKAGVEIYETVIASTGSWVMVMVMVMVRVTLRND
jgi:hypothetical protein